MKLSDQKIRDCSEGIIQFVDTSILPVNSVYLGVNFLFDEILGRAVLRPGTTQLGNQIVSGKSCIGLYQHITTAGLKVPIAIFNDSSDINADIYALSGATWSLAKNDITKDLKVRFETFLDTTIAVNGAESMSTDDGTNWVITGGNLDVGNMPAVTMIREWQDRLFAAGDPVYPDRLYFSSIQNGVTISWTSGNGYIDIEPEEGAGAISALAKVPGYFLIFKERSLKRWDGSSTYPDDLITIGTPTQESVIMTRQCCYYFNKRGIYETTGGYPRKISRRIQKIIDAIPASYYSKISGWGTGEQIIYSIGDISIDDLDLTNCVIIYNIESQNWSLLSFPKEFKLWHQYIDSDGDELIMAGDDDGNIWKIFEGDDDDGSPINWLIQYQSQEFGTRGRKKELSKYVIYTKNVRNGIFTCRIDEKGEFRPLGNKSKVNNDVEEIIGSISGRYFEFRIQGQGKSVEIIGIDFPEVNVTLNYVG
ncbi:hypothetical protein M0R01_04420 [bacterium]|jgi:hypothetical protein|nr:hypothetical protein [bacterium]